MSTSVAGVEDRPDRVRVVLRDLAGADAVFWLVPPDPRADSAGAAFVDFTRPACDAFKRHEVKRMVGVSVLGRGTPWAANAGLVTGSLAMDDLIAGCPRPWPRARSTCWWPRNQGLDNAEPRTPQSATPTSFRQWCEEVLKPAVLA